jgi:hypothetical protein
MMNKEPNELMEARTSLKKWEESLHDPKTLTYLKQGISLLSDVAMGNYAQVYKDRANNIVVGYRNRILSEVRGILSNGDSYELDSLVHWHNAMAVFSDVGFEDDEEFKVCKDRLLSAWASRWLRGLSPSELQEIRRLQQQKTIVKGE